MGPFLTAYMRVHQGDGEAPAQAKAWLKEFKSHLSTAGLGQISEIADGGDGHRTRGCVAQAWSVAELLRAACEDVYSVSSKKEQSAAAAALVLE